MSGSFTWSEDFDENINYWFWLRREGLIADHILVDEVRHSINRNPVESHARVTMEAHWNDYLQEWRKWKRDQAMATVEDSHATPPKVSRAHYKALAAVGLPLLRVEWVMAPLGERWLFPPDIALLGIEGSTAEQRRGAVVDAARALRER